MKVCSSCFNDIELSAFIDENSTEVGLCNFCTKEKSKLMDAEELRDFFIEYFEIFKEDDNGQSLDDTVRKDWNLFSNEKILQGILDFVETSFNSKSNVAYVDEIVECVSYWQVLKEDLKWTRRFLTDTSNIFELGWDGYFNKQLSLGKDEILFRARIHRNEGEPPYLIEQMGCPERLYATGGRANPQGIPYLYLSKSIETTFYETRAAYLDEVSIGKFRLKVDRDIVLVDFTENISAFLNSGNILEYTKSLFLKRFISSDLSKPLRRYDSELEYVPTQFICEFIRYITGADGIVFNSSLHVGGKNIVLFNEDKLECFEVEKYQVNNINIVGDIFNFN